MWWTNREKNQVGDGFDKFRDELGADKVNKLMACLGMGPLYKPAPPKTRVCPNCKGTRAQVKERHADTDMNCMAIVCPDCHYDKEI